MAEKTLSESKGLLQSLTILASTLVSIAHTRLELFSADLEDGCQYVVSILVLALAALFCLGVGVVLATILVVVAFWDTHRLFVLGTLAGFFLAGGMAAWGFVMHKARRKPKLFEASLSELFKDRQQLVSGS